MTDPRIHVTARETADGWVAAVTVSGERRTSHRVTISQAEHERFGGGDVASLVVRSFEFLLEREPNTSILREFRLSAIEQYFPEYAAAIRR